MYDDEIQVADRFYASSKTCSDCGEVVSVLPLSVREWDCPSCGVVHDRDENAAQVLENWAASSAATACRLGGAGSTRKRRTKLPIGQEPNTERGVSLFGSVWENGSADANTCSRETALDETGTF